MSMVGESIQRGSIALAGMCLALDLTGFSATAVVRRNSVATPAAASGLTEPSDTSAVSKRAGPTPIGTSATPVDRSND